MIKNIMQILHLKANNKGKINAQTLKKKLRDAVNHNNAAIEQLNQEIANLNAQLEAETAKREKKFNVHPSTMKKLITKFNKKTPV